MCDAVNVERLCVAYGTFSDRVLVFDSSGSPRQSAAGREKIKAKLWMSAAVDDYFLRKNDDMMEKLLPKIRAGAVLLQPLFAQDLRSFSPLLLSFASWTHFGGGVLLQISRRIRHTL